MSFQWPLALLALLVVPAAFTAWLFVQRRPSRYAVAFTNLDVLAEVVDRSTPWRRWVPPAIFLLALAALAVGFARPKVSIMAPSERATIVLAIDSSGSMMAEDVKPTRFVAAQDAVRTFLDDLPPKVRVGMMTFAADTEVVTPPTTDRAIVRQSLEFLVPLRGTAIGDAVGRASEVARDAVDPQTSRTLASYSSAAADEEERRPAAVLFLSDGFQTTGLLTPLDGAARARELGIPVYTIALGTDRGVVQFGFGPERREVPVPPDRESLRMIAEQTKGKYFDAPTAEALKAAYKELGSLLGEEPKDVEATAVFLAVGAALGVVAAALSAVWFARIP